ncbi:Uncharacterised protein [Streptococcus pneumoniae]|nr:Uncharacterised protein [Streptococcus pneumoniae]
MTSCSNLIIAILLLFNTTTTIGSLYLTAVTKSFIVIPKPPSPQTANTCLSGNAIFPARAPGKPQPSVASQLEMTNCWFVIRKCLAVHTVTFPTSTDRIASSCATCCRACITRCGLIGMEESSS